MKDFCKVEKYKEEEKYLFIILLGRDNNQNILKCVNIVFNRCVIFYWIFEL